MADRCFTSLSGADRHLLLMKGNEGLESKKLKEDALS
jgi:hypothetical protein